MRGWLRAPVSGEYHFWIASDNSSELWLSSDDTAAAVRRIAFIEPRNWVQPGNGRVSLRKSDPIFLRAGQSYYIEAFQEQLAGDDNLAVAWEGPSLAREVLGGDYLTPWTEGADSPVHGILREYWTNYAAGTLAGVTGARPFKALLAAPDCDVTALEPAAAPEARRVSIGQRLLPGDNFRWSDVEGKVSFVGFDGVSAMLELTDGQLAIPVRVASDKVALFNHARARVTGVCEAAVDDDFSRPDFFGPLPRRMLFCCLTRPSMPSVFPETRRSLFGRRTARHRSAAFIGHAAW